MILPCFTGDNAIFLFQEAAVEAVQYIKWEIKFIIKLKNLKLM